MKKLIMLACLGCALYTCLIILAWYFNWFSVPFVIITYWVFGGLSVLNISKILLNPIRHISIHDKLTGCHNRLYLSQKILEYENYNDYAIIFFDINNFKKVNDAHGHIIGDKVLIKASNLLRYWFTYGDLYRIGGDEFIVVIPNSNTVKIEALITDWYNKLPLLNEEYKSIDTFDCTFSYGIAYKMENMSFQEVLGVADEQMYLMKKMIKEKEQGEING